MIKAVIFDCFGVLVNDGWLPFKEKHFPVDSIAFQKASQLNQQSDSGEITYEAFLDGIAQLAGLDSQTTRGAIEDNPANEHLIEYIAGLLKPSYKIGLLSNASQNWLHDLFTPEQNSLFDASVLSCEVGVIKPHPKMYQTISEELGVEPAECIFVDDQERYCEGARSVGMQVIQFKNNEQCIADIAQYLKPA